MKVPRFTDKLGAEVINQQQVTRRGRKYSPALHYLDRIYRTQSRHFRIEAFLIYLLSARGTEFSEQETLVSKKGADMVMICD